MYRIGICDDDESYYMILKKTILECNRCDRELEIDYASSGKQFLELPRIKEYNLVFIDIVLGDTDGGDVAEKLRRVNNQVLIVLCSAVQNPTPRYFRLSVYRYIIKANQKETAEAVSSALERMREIFGERGLLIPKKGGAVHITTDSIVYIQKTRGGTELILTDENGHREHIKSTKKMNDLYAELQKMRGCCFGYPHNSYLVNIKYVSGLNKKYLTLNNGEELNIARDRFTGFNRAFINAKGSKYERGSGL